MLPADYHMHTPLCRHAVGEPSAYAAAALAAGFREIGFSDHSPMRRDDFDNWRMRLDQLGEYVEKVRRAQKDRPSMQIKLALEVDYLPGHEDWIRDLASRHPWDYFIGAVHYVSDDWALDNPEHISRWRESDPFEVWSLYFARLTQAAESGLFETIAHADLPKKFNFRPVQDCSPLFHKFLDAVNKNNIALEINTAGLRKDCREIYPSRAILEIAAEKKTPVTFGSDAHAPGEVGMAFGEAVALARAAGCTHWRRFTRRKHEETAIV
jgi:histidinol-phosphatase (PHP family)